MFSSAAVDKLAARFTGTGDSREWKQYKVRVLAHAANKGWEKALLEDRFLPSSTWLEENEEHAQYDKHKATREDNKKAWAYLAQTTDQLALDELMMSDGDAREAWKAFENKYEPNSNLDCIRVLTEFENCKLQDYPNPEAWILRLETRNLELGRMKLDLKKSDNWMNSIILSRLPSEYDTLIPTLHAKNEITGLGALTVRELKRQLQAFYESRLKAQNPQNLAMTAEKIGGGEERGQYQRYNAPNRSPYRRFNGNCHYCGKWGHRQIRCFQ